MSVFRSKLEWRRLCLKFNMGPFCTVRTFWSSLKTGFSVYKKSGAVIQQRRLQALLLFPGYDILTEPFFGDFLCLTVFNHLGDRCLKFILELIVSFFQTDGVFFCAKAFV